MLICRGDKAHFAELLVCTDWRSIVKGGEVLGRGQQYLGCIGRRGSMISFAPSALGKFTGRRRRANCPRRVCPLPDHWLISTSFLPGVREPTLSFRVGATALTPPLQGDPDVWARLCPRATCPPQPFLLPHNTAGRTFCLVSMFYLGEELAPATQPRLDLSIFSTQQSRQTHPTTTMSWHVR